MALEPVLFRVLTDDAVPVPIDGVTVAVYTSPGDVYVTEGVTAVGTGEVSILLEDGPSDYYVRMYKQGVSFPGAPFSITVDTPPPPNELEVNAHVGETLQVVVISLEDELAASVDNVTAVIYDDADIFITDLETGDSNPGEAEIPLPGAVDPGQDYFVRWRPPAGKRLQNGLTQIIQVLDPLVPPETNIFDFVIEDIPTPASDEDSMCLIYGYLADVSKQPIRQGTIVFLPRLFEPDAKVSGLPFPTQPTVVDNKILVNEVRVETDDNGYVEVKLPRTSIFDVHVYGLETPGVEIISQVYIPDQPGARLEDVLFPYVESVDTEFGSVSMSVDETEELELTVVGSNGQPVTAGLSAFIEFTSSDEDVVSVSIGDEGQLLLTALSAGSATITVSRVEDTSAPRVPAIPDLVVTPSTEITVTVT
jgi:hypothetical protein